MTGRCDAREYLIELGEPAGHGGEHLRVQAIETHCDALQPGRTQRGGVLGEQHAVGGQRDVFDARKATEIPDQTGSPARTSGSPPVMRSFVTPSDTKARADAPTPRSQALGAAQEAVLLVERSRGMQ